MSGAAIRTFGRGSSASESMLSYNKRDYKAGLGFVRGVVENSQILTHENASTLLFHVDSRVLSTSVTVYCSK